MSDEICIYYKNELIEYAVCGTQMLINLYA